MPRKTFSEMNWFQRSRNSLAGKTFLSLALFSLIVSIAAISFGYYLYYSSVRRDYRNRTWQMSRTANQFMDKEEALDEASQDIFGIDRVIEALNQNKDSSPEDILHNVRGAVDRFANGAAQFDDITMLCLEYMGPDSDDTPVSYEHY